MCSLKVVDISKPDEETVKELFEAATTQGFLYIDGHDFTQNEVDELYDVSKEFFCSVSTEEKLRYSIRSNNIGYTDFCNENLDPRKARDFKEGYNFGELDYETGEFRKTDTADDRDYLPDFFKQKEDIIGAAAKKLHENSRKILRLLAIALGIPDVNFFVSRFRSSEPSGSILRFLRYPLIRDNGIDGSFDPSIRAGAHTDYGALTLLFQRQGEQGLQLQLEEDKWTDVNFITSAYQNSAPPFIVNFGDLMSYWTGGLLKSTIHRVKFLPGETRNSDRYSIVFFMHPENDTTLVPVPSKYVKQEDNQERGQVRITAAQHLQKRLTETYQQRAK